MFARLSLNIKKATVPMFYKQCLPSVSLNTSRNKSVEAHQERIVITDDGSTIICWHPPKKFPYEYSRPILKEETKPVHSVLKVENKSEIYTVFKSQDETKTREELMKLTHTTMHRWFPKSSRHKKLYKRIKGDREWL